MMLFTLVTLIMAMLTGGASPASATPPCYQQNFKLGGDGTFKTVEVASDCAGKARRLAFHFPVLSVGVVNNTPLEAEVFRRVMDCVQDIFIVPMKDVQVIMIQTLPLAKAPVALVLVDRVFQFAPGEPFSSWPGSPVVRITISFKGVSAEHILETAIREGVKRRPALCEEEKLCEAEVKFVIPPPKPV